MGMGTTILGVPLKSINITWISAAGAGKLQPGIKGYADHVLCLWAEQQRLLESAGNPKSCQDDVFAIGGDLKASAAGPVLTSGAQHELICICRRSNRIPSGFERSARVSSGYWLKPMRRVGCS